MCKNVTNTCIGNHFNDCAKLPYIDGVKCREGCNDKIRDKGIAAVQTTDYNCIAKHYLTDFLSCLCPNPDDTCPGKFFKTCFRKIFAP